MQDYVRLQSGHMAFLIQALVQVCRHCPLRWTRIC
jgi:hypothetical protein